jgi:hypothetical protein
MKIGFVSLSVVFLLTVGCTNRLNTYEKETALLVAQTDTILGDLNRIDTTIVRKLYTGATETARRFKETVTDTLTLEFTYRLDSFLVAKRQLENTAVLRNQLYERTLAAKKRCRNLYSDIGKGAGERSEYPRFVQAERREIRFLSQESKSLLETFRTSNAAITQFQPEIERFISRFVQPVTLP